MRLIQKAKELEEGKEDTHMMDFFKTIPFLELQYAEQRTGAEVFNDMEPPRCLKTHLPLALFTKHLEKNPNLKVIQTLRNPKDCLVSFFYHLQGDKSLGGFNGTWDQYFELVKEQKLPWGDFFVINSEWYKFNKHRENSLILKYEDMIADHRGHVMKIAKFMGYNNLSDKVIDKITEQSDFKVAAPKLNAFITEDASSWRAEKATFMRKGKTGGWREYFSQEQSEYVDRKFKEYLEPLGLFFDYDITSWKDPEEDSSSPKL